MPISQEVFKKILEDKPEIRAIDLSYQSLSSHDVILLVLALKKNLRITTLNLECNKIGPLGAEALAELPTLTELNISDNEIGNKGTIYLAKLTTLTVLNVSRNKIGEEGAWNLSALPALTELFFENNSPLSDKAQKYLQNTISKNKLEAESMAQSIIQNLDLNGEQKAISQENLSNYLSREDLMRKLILQKPNGAEIIVKLDQQLVDIVTIACSRPLPFPMNPLPKELFEKIIDLRNLKEYSGFLEFGREILERGFKGNAPISDLPAVFLDRLKQQKTPMDWNKYSEETVAHAIINYLSPELKFDDGEDLQKYRPLITTKERLNFLHKTDSDKGRLGLESHAKYQEIMGRVYDYYKEYAPSKHSVVAAEIMCFVEEEEARGSVEPVSAVSVSKPKVAVNHHEA